MVLYDGCTLRSQNYCLLISNLRQRVLIFICHVFYFKLSLDTLSKLLVKSTRCFISSGIVWKNIDLRKERENNVRQLHGAFLCVYITEIWFLIFLPYTDFFISHPIRDLRRKLSWRKKAWNNNFSLTKLELEMCHYFTIITSCLSCFLERLTL